MDACTQCINQLHASIKILFSFLYCGWACLDGPRIDEKKTSLAPACCALSKSKLGLI